MKTSELTGAALDWAVAKCEGITEDIQHWCLYDDYMTSIGTDIRFSPSTNWAQGGPIIEREEISLRDPCSVNMGDDWEAVCGGYHRNGPTPLIAAMRCYVASKLGDEVEIPEGL